VSLLKAIPDGLVQLIKGALLYLWFQDLRS